LCHPLIQLSSSVLTYAYAELLEQVELNKNERDFTEVHNVYNRFFDELHADLVKLSASLIGVPAGESSVDANRTQDQLTVRKKQYTEAWISYMRFVRRAEGHKAYRDAFGKARKEEHIGCEVYEAAGA
jgi:hypothetical protein